MQTLSKPRLSGRRSSRGHVLSASRTSNRAVSCLVHSAREQLCVSQDALRGLELEKKILSRRGALSALLAFPAAMLLSSPVKADEVSSSVYKDTSEGFSITVPAGWASTEGAIPGNNSFSGSSGERRTLAWFPETENPRDVNVSLVITNTSQEFTKLGSFGNVYAFANTLVASQDRSYLLRAPEFVRNREKLQIAKLIDAREARDCYIVEYTIEAPPEPKRYLISLVTLAPNRMYNRLFTLTAQCTADKVPVYEKVLKDIASSFVPPARTA